MTYINAIHFFSEILGSENDSILPSLVKLYLSILIYNTTALQFLLLPQQKGV